MTRENIFEMLAKVYGVAWTSQAQLKDLTAFAELVAAAEREACAKVADAYEPRCDSCPSGVVNAIRARGQV